MASLSGKVAIVTGASSGIGRAIAERLAEDGAIVVVNYGTSGEKAQQVVTGIQAKGGKAVAVQSDMSQVSEARRLVAEMVKQFSRLDILVNYAGRFMPKPLMETTEEDFDHVIALNAKGPYFAMQEAAHVLKEGGRIVNISTDGTHLSFPGATAYLGSKGALEQYTKGLAQEMAPSQTGTVSALMMGFAWGSAGMVFIPLVGYAADLFSLHGVLASLVVFPVIGGLLTLKLPKCCRKSRIQAWTTTATNQLQAVS